MKTLLLTALCLLAGFNSFAQINMADSTSQIIGYWEKGETQRYRIINERIHLSGADTTKKESSSQEVEIVVLDSTENSYTIEWRYKNILAPSPNPLVRKIVDAMENRKIIYKTDELGAFIELVNWEDLKNLQTQMLEMTADAIAEYPESDKAVEFVKQFASQFGSKEAIEAHAIQDILIFHSFHGGKYQLGESLQGQLEIPSFLGNGTLTADVTVLLKDIDEEDDFSLMTSYQTVDPDQLIDATLSFLTSTAATIGTEPPQRENFAGLTHEVSHASSIHGSGWVLYSIMTKIVHLDDTVQIEEHSMELL